MNNKLRKIRSAFTKHWTTIWLLIALIAVSTLTVHAVYTRLTIAKRVVSTAKGSGELFSSNYMNTKTMSTNGAIYELDKDGNAKVTLEIYNYAAPKRIPYYKELETLDYTLTAKLVKNSDGDELTNEDETNISGLNYKFNDQSFSASNNYTINLGKQHLNSNQSNKNAYTLLFDKTEISNLTAYGYMIYVTATPDPITEYKTISGYIGVREREIIPAGWYGELVETDASTEYDGYNYEIKGSGRGYLKITYNNTSLIPNEAVFADSSLTFVNKFHSDINNGDYITDNGDGTSSFWLKLGFETNDGTFKKTRLNIQFYKINKETNYSISAVNSMITYDWEQSN